MRPKAYIATNRAGEQRLVFADTAGQENALLFGETLEPLFSAREVRPEWTGVEISKLRRIAGTMTTEDIAIEFGRTKSSIVAMACKLNISLHFTGNKDRWSPEQIEIYNRMKAEGATNGEIAKATGRKKKSVSQRPATVARSMRRAQRSN